MEVERVRAEHRPRAVTLWFLDFHMSEESGLLLLVASAAVAGAAVHLILVFTERAGYRTLEAGYLWWYLLRPVAAALLSVLFVIAVRTGLSTLGTAQPTTPSVPVLLTAGGLAGLFTDRVLQQMRNLLGSTDPETPASDQKPPADRKSNQKTTANRQPPASARNQPPGRRPTRHNASIQEN